MYTCVIIYLMYDILYSITAHEAPDCVIDLIKNIFAYHPALHVGIIIHTSHYLYSELYNAIPYKHVWIHPKPFDKQWCSYGIFLGHILNFTFILEHTLQSRYVCVLASNCMFHRPVTLQILDDKYAESDETYIPTAPMPPIPEWAPTYQLSCNKPFFAFFHQYGIPFVNSYHEGVFFPWNVMKQIATFRDCINMRSLITIDFSFEEVLFSSLHLFFTGRRVRSICTMKQIEIHTIHEIQNPCVKTVARKYNDPVRVWLRKDTSLYSLNHLLK